MEHKQQGTMKGRVCLVTGGTGGIGRATAEGLASLGATVIVVGRNRSTGEAAVADIRAKSHNDDVELLLADLSSQAEIRQLAQDAAAKHRQLHVLINNVGNMQTQYRQTVDGIELTFALNVLAPFLLTHLLLPLLKASTPSRIINVNSTAHRFVGLVNFDNLQAVQSYRGMDIYSQAKLANLLFTYELAHRLAGTGCTVNAADPGFTISAPGPDSTRSWYSLLMRPFMQIGSHIMTTTRAARSSIYAASSPKLEHISGKYVSSTRRIAKSSKASYDETTAQRLWKTCMELTGLAQEQDVGN